MSVPTASVPTMSVPSVSDPGASDPDISACRAPPPHCEIDARALQALIERDAVILVDVREPDEYAAEHITGAINRPLSRFDPAALPASDGMTIVLQCAGGKRSGMALERCRIAEAAVKTHLAGGLAAWKAAGLPTIRN